MRERATSVEPGASPRIEEEAGGGASEDELIRRATADRAAERDASSDVDSLLEVAADQNRAALDRLAR